MKGKSGAEERSAIPRRFLIATTVDDYPHAPQWNRPGLAEGRKRIVDLFTTELGYTRPRVLGPNPEKTQFTHALREFCKSTKLRHDDLLAVYVGAHGEVLEDGEHVLLFSDAHPGDLDYTALRTAELARTILSGTRVRRLLFILDACYSRQGSNEMAAEALKRIGLQWTGTRDPLASHEGLLLLSSSQPYQLAVSGVLPRLLKQAVLSLSTAGYGPDALSADALVQHMNDNKGRPASQRIGLDLIGLTGRQPPFFPSPRHNPLLVNMDVAQQEAAFAAHAERREKELTTRLLTRAMGSHGIASGKWLFRGRRRVLTELSAWIAPPQGSGPPAGLVVTGGPGSGKTAVLGLLAVLNHADWRRTVPLERIDLDPDRVPAVGALDVTIYAEGLTDAEVLRGLASTARIPADSVTAFLTALGTQRRARPFTVLIDALDEAATPLTLCTDVLRPLLQQSDGQLRLLLGTRPHLLRHLGLAPPDEIEDRESVISLDHPAYADPDAMVAYTAETLVAAHPHSPYRARPEETLPVARSIAEAAGRSFLVAQITARTHAAMDTVPDAADLAWRAGLPRFAGDAMRQDLEGRLGPEASRAADLLRPLAYAEGQGLPWEDVWATLATAMADRIRTDGEHRPEYGDEDLMWLRRAAGSYIVESVASDRSAYRLYHKALAEYLREGTDHQAMHAAVVDTLLDRIPRRLDGAREWSRAHPYTLRHVGTHAANAGRADSMAVDVEFLIHADPLTVAACLTRVRSDRALLARSVYRTSAGLHRLLTSGLRRQVLSLDAARHGATPLQYELTDGARDDAWAPLWATGTHVSPALRESLRHDMPSTALTVCALDHVPVAVTGDAAGYLHVWDLGTGLYHGAPFWAVHLQIVTALAPVVIDGTPALVVAGGDATLQVWNLDTRTRWGAPLLDFSFTEEQREATVWCVVCTEVDGVPVAVTAGHDGTITVWDLRNRRRFGVPLAGHEGRVKALACVEVEGAPAVVSASADGTARLWGLRTGKQVGEPFLGHSGPVQAVACTTLDGVPYAVTGGTDGTLLRWNLVTGEPLGRPLLADPVHSLTCVTVADRSVIVSGTRHGTVTLHDLATGERVGSPLTGHTNAVYGVVCTEIGGSPVVVSRSQHTVHVWDLKHEVTRQAPKRGHAGPVRAVSASQVDGVPVAVSAAADDTIHIRRRADGKLVRAWTFSGEQSPTAVHSLERDGFSLTFIGHADGSVGVWRHGMHEERVSPLTRLPGGPIVMISDLTVGGAQAVVAASFDGAVTAIDLASGQRLGATVPGEIGPRMVDCVVREGVPVAVIVGDSTAHMVDLTSGRVTGGPLEDAERAPLEVACTTMNGTPVAVISYDDNALRVWNLLTCHQIGSPLRGHVDFVHDVVCTTVRGTALAVSTSQDDTARIWDLSTQQCVGVVAGPGIEVAALTPQGDLLTAVGADLALYRLKKWAENPSP